MHSTRSWGLVAWRLAIAVCALLGVWLAAQQYDVWWTAFSQLASLVTGVGYLVLAVAGASGRSGPRRALASEWFRGAVASTMALVAIAFLAMEHGNLFDPYSIFEHMVTPAAVIADRLLVGSERNVTRWWHPWSWLVPPAAYLVSYVALDLRVYVDLNPSSPVDFTTNTTVLLGVLLAAAYSLHVVARVRPSIQ
jgi:hypothetical protein